MNRIKILFLALLGEITKFACHLGFYPIKYALNTTNKRSCQVVVSLTSYGRRVSAVLPYTIVSLLRQTYKPDVVVLWLDYDNWNDDNLPKSLKKLQKKGLTIRYCEDLKSYKKLIPALETYPDALIITVDDDIYYKRNMVERLVKAYEDDSRFIYSHRAHEIKFAPNGDLLPYNSWEEEISGFSGRFVFPTSGGGCLYKRQLLYKDICNKELFMNLAPKADDVWFYFMEVMQNTSCKVLPYKGYIYIPLDAFYQHFHQGSSLASTNCNELQNDVQIKAVMEYYGLMAKDLKIEK